MITKEQIIDAVIITFGVSALFILAGATAVVILCPLITPQAHLTPSPVKGVIEVSVTPMINQSKE